MNYDLLAEKMEKEEQYLDKKKFYYKLIKFDYTELVNIYEKILSYYQTHIPFDELSILLSEYINRKYNLYNKIKIALIHEINSLYYETRDKVYGPEKFKTMIKIDHKKICPFEYKNTICCNKLETFKFDHGTYFVNQKLKKIEKAIQTYRLFGCELFNKSNKKNQKELDECFAKISDSSAVLVYTYTLMEYVNITDKFFRKISIDDKEKKFLNCFKETYTNLRNAEIHSIKITREALFNEVNDEFKFDKNVYMEYNKLINELDTIKKKYIETYWINDYPDVVKK